MWFGWERLSEADLAKIARGIAAGRPYGGPWHLEIHPTDKCNLDCFFCSTKPLRAARSLEWPLLERRLTEGARGDLRFLRISGGGESLCYPEMRSLLDLCERQGLRIVELTTNATLLAPLAQRLVEAGTDYVHVSLNESDPKRYARAMQVDERMFRQAVRGIEAVCSERDAAPPDRKPQVALQLFLWKENWRETRAMYEFGLSLGVDLVLFQSIRNLDPSQRLDEEETRAAKEILGELIAEDAAPDRRRLKFGEILEKGLARFVFEEQWRSRPDLARHKEEYREAIEKTACCYIGWYSALIAANALVYPCCILYGLPGKDLGDVRRQTLAKIWTGKPFQGFRKEIRRLMASGERLADSPRPCKVLEPVCLHRGHCFLSYYLCSPQFYGQAAEGAAGWPLAAERAKERLLDAAIRAARRAKSAVRPRSGR